MEMEPKSALHEDPLQSSGKRLLGKVAIITGGARGIGATTAKLFAENGAHVVIADILDELGLALADSICGRYIHCDVTKERDVESAVQLAVTWKGQLDIMFNNAGVPCSGGSITRLDMEEVQTVVAVNVNGIIHGIKYAAKAMIDGGRGGSIMSSASSAAVLGGLGGHAYTLTKEAMIGLMKTAALELGEHGIRVNCISPHGVPSEMLVLAYRKFSGNMKITAEDVRKQVSESASLLRGRGGTEEDVAHAALFLASPESGFITAHNLVVDGGYTSSTTALKYIYL